MYFELFSVQRKLRNAILAGLISSAIIALASTVIACVFFLRRPGQTWLQMLESGQSHGFGSWAPVHGTLMLLLDIYILVLPLDILRKLNMTTNKKIQLAVVFATAMLCVGSHPFRSSFRGWVVRSCFQSSNDH
jgi:hypothetical protein